MSKRLKHGEYVGGKESPEHYVWREMLRRCRNGDKYYVGVQVCTRWLSFENFLADIGRRPSAAYQIDRINPHGNYQPGNVRWATRSAQQKNKRTTKRWTHNGQTGTLVEWAERLGISKQLAYYRMKTWGTFEIGKVFY